MDRYCAEPGCPQIVSGRRAYCQPHDPWEKREPWANSASRLHRAGSSGWAWTAIKRRVMRRDRHKCRRCGQPASEVDHVIPVAECIRRGAEPDDMANLQALCKPCHARKTEADRLYGVRRGQRESQNGQAAGTATDPQRDQAPPRQSGEAGAS